MRNEVVPQNKVAAYRPLGRMEADQRDKLLKGALAMLAGDKTLFDVARRYKISKTTLIAALSAYAETEWKDLQIARAQVAVQRASQKRTEIAAQLDAFQALEKAGGKTTETAMTYPRIREQLRIAEHEEKSAQWHLERLHKRLYGNSVAMTIDPTSYEADSELIETMGRLLEGVASSKADGSKKIIALPAMLPPTSPPANKTHNEGLTDEEGKRSSSA
jgi:hypothetical protein